MHGVASEALEKHRELKNQYRHYELEGASGEFRTHELLLKILRGDLPPEYITELDGGEDVQKPEEDNKTDKRPNLTDADEQLIKNALKQSWVHTRFHDSYMESIKGGNEGCVLAVLLPLLTNLRWFVAPNGTERVWTICYDIALATRNGERSTDLPEATQRSKSLPLSKLVLISCRAYNGTDFGISLEGAVALAALPSVRRFVFRACRNSEFAGSPTVPDGSITVPEVFFTDSTVTAEAIKGFAKLWGAPCKFMQSWNTLGGQYPQDTDIEWDHYEIGGDVDEKGYIKEGTRWEKMELKYEDAHDDPSAGAFGASRRDSDFSEMFNQLIDEEIVDWTQL